MMCRFVKIFPFSSCNIISRCRCTTRLKRGWGRRKLKIQVTALNLKEEVCLVEIIREQLQSSLSHSYCKLPFEIAMPNPNTSDVEKHQRKPAAASKAGNWPPEETPLFPEIGYGKIALDMAAAGSEMPIFRKFGDLSMLALLRLQADILHRRERFRKLCRTSEGPPQFLNSFQWMREDCRCSPTRGFRGNESGAANDEVSQIGVDQSSQKDCPECLLREITEKLKEYRQWSLLSLLLDFPFPPSHSLMVQSRRDDVTPG